MQDDPRHPFDAERFLDGFTETERQVPVPADSPIGRAMARHRPSVRRGEVEPLDGATWTVEPVPVGT